MSAGAAGPGTEDRAWLRRRLAWNALIALAAAGFSLGLALWPPFQTVEARVFDLFSTIAPPPIAPPPGESGIVIVAIDEPSFAEAGQRWPWPRSLHGELVEALRRAGARAIGLDMVFAEPSDPAEDAALARAMGPDVVLAADESVIETPQGRQILRAEPLAALTAAGARSGLASVALDRDGTLRRLPPWPGTFAARLREAAGEGLRAPEDQAAGQAESRGNAGPEAGQATAAGQSAGTPAPPGQERPGQATAELGAAEQATGGQPTPGQGAQAPPPRGYIQTFGPARSYPTVSYYQALDPGAFLPEGYFRDRIVLVGLSLQTAVQADAAGADAFATSQTLRSGQLVPGVEMQATILDNLRRGLFIRPAGIFVQGTAIALAALAAALIAWRPVDHRAYLAGGALLLLIGGTSFLLLREGRVFLPPLAPALAALFTLAPIGVRDQARERRMRREITRAFAHYLAPEMVRRLARDPSSLRLGGERRVLSILFCDLRNFTPLAEGMKDEPERLTHLVNRILTPLSAAALDQGGTIDKYIGDCVMAFWNAPLDDPDHAVHAATAGLAMLAAIDRLNAEFAAEGSEARLAVGVGINTGACVVGNMGSDRRFDYTALGDAVNYASRLEGASKACGAPLLLSAATVGALAEAGGQKGEGPRVEGQEAAGQEAAGQGKGAAPGQRFDPVLVGRIAVKGRSAPEPVYTILRGPRLPPEILARHAALMADLAEGRRGPGDPEIAALAGEAPALAPILAAAADRGAVALGGG